MDVAGGAERWVIAESREREMANTQKDPVCGMQVDEAQAAGKSEYHGQTYYFCSASCKTKFDQNPEQYTAQAGKAQGLS